ncbi:protein sax-3-like [Corticium candelabrum]|uniref:protein sax-3-like n=1 Tax=Corticium candelabrum TaxID=121492 RepID=UPI002E25C227|nr:protein sax-3-like [Corticium candelabrum]
MVLVVLFVQAILVTIFYGCEGAVKVQVPSQVAEKGSVTLSCITDETVIRWTNGPSQTVIDSGRLRLSSDSKELDILKVQKSDEGTYYCHTRNTNGITHSHHGRMHVIVPPTVRAHGAFALEGKSVNLRCTGSNFFTVSWRFNGVELYGKSTSRYSFDGDSGESLTILNVTKADHGTYNCLASNMLFTVSAYANLSVHSLSTDDAMKSSPDSEIVVLSSNVTRLSAASQGRVEWRKNQRIIDLSVNPRISQLGSGAILISNVEYNDSGVYECLMTDGSDTVVARREILLTVEGPPAAPIIDLVMAVNQSYVHVEWSTPLLAGRSPVRCKVGVKCGNQSEWRNTSLPVLQHSATVGCQGASELCYVVVVTVNNHREGESDIRQLHMDMGNTNYPSTQYEASSWKITRDDASTAKTLVNIDINKSEKLHAAKSVDIGPVVGLSLAIGLIMSGVIVVVAVVYVRRKKGDTKQAAGDNSQQREISTNLTSQTESIPPQTDCTDSNSASSDTYTANCSN